MTCARCKARRATPGTSRCKKCRQAAKDAYALARVQRLVDGRCIKCGKRKPVAGTRYCRPCKKMHREANAKWAAKTYT